MFSIVVLGYCPFASFSYCFVMSQTVNKAMETSVSASISTPVWALVLTVAETSMVDLPRIFASTSTLVSGKGWHRGIKPLVFLAASTPAIFAVYNGSPFAIFRSFIRLTVSGFSFIVPFAVASRKISAFPETSTITILLFLPRLYGGYCLFYLFPCFYQVLHGFCFRRSFVKPVHAYSPVNRLPKYALSLQQLQVLIRRRIVQANSPRDVRHVQRAKPRDQFKNLHPRLRREHLLYIHNASLLLLFECCT